MYRSLFAMFPALAAVLSAQTAPPPPEAIRREIVIMHKDGPPGAPGAANVFYQREAGLSSSGIAGPMTVQLLGAELSVEQVKNAPYSAQSITETTQTLADGNRIHRTNTASVWRDSEGRTRREQTLAGFGPLAPQDAPTMVFIADPVAGVSYTLDARARTARKLPAPPSVNRAMTFTRNAPPPPDVLVRPARPQVRNESLGKQVIEGIEAQGTRTVMVIPAGEMGNERPIETVFEQWVSPELKVTVMSRHNDPRSGETVYRLTNINRAEPPGSLFEVPADYTVADR